MARVRRSRSERQRVHKCWCFAGPNGELIATHQKTRKDAITAFIRLSESSIIVDDAVIDSLWKEAKHERGWRIVRKLLFDIGDLRERTMLRGAVVKLLRFQECLEDGRPGMDHLKQATRLAKGWNDQFGDNL